MRTTEEHFRLLVEQLTDGMLLSDASGRFLDANPVASNTLGYARDELARMSLADIIAPHELPRLASEMARFASRQVVRSEWCLRRKDGTSFYGEVAAIQLADGRLQATLRDTTARRQADTAIRDRRTQLQELQQLHIASLTAAAIAHELGQPLSAVVSYSEAALHLLRAGDAQTGRLLRALEGSAEEAKRAGRVVRELLAFLHKHDLPSEPVDLNEAVRKAVAIMHSDGLHAFHINLALEPNLRPVQANLLQVEKVLVNLLSNAVDAIAGAGVRPGTVTIVVRTLDEDGMAHVTVQDNGPGLDEKTVRRIFEPFYTTKRKGIGMGLAISRALIEAHGGKLWFDLPPNGGAAFHFTLPFAA